MMLLIAISIQSLVKFLRGSISVGRLMTREIQNGRKDGWVGGGHTYPTK
jgi:hypothetical protein